MRRRMMSRLLVFGISVALTLGACGLGRVSDAGTAGRSSPASRTATPGGSSPAPSGAPSSPGSAPTGKPTIAPITSSLAVGAKGAQVRALQIRLDALHYYPGAIDGIFGSNTLEAVWAFQEVQGLPVTGLVGPLTRRALADPRSPVALMPGGGSMRVEIHLASHVLVLYVNDEVRLIGHVSTGGGYYYCSPGGGCGYAVTPTGDFATTTFMPGWVTVPLGVMYNPVFFIGTAYAIHGSNDVPLEPASHGCVRIPMDIAEFFHTLLKTPGTPVYVRAR